MQNGTFIITDVAVFILVLITIGTDFMYIQDKEKFSSAYLRNFRYLLNISMI